MMKAIFLTALLAGSLDILAAFLQGYISNGISPGIILQYIASGVMGGAAYTAGGWIMALGLLFHFMIAFACTAVFFWIYPGLSFLKKSIVLNAVLIGLSAWVVTTRLIIPLSRIRQRPFDLSGALIAMAILVVCIGLPVAYFAKRYYAGRVRDV